jgi:hypothetical protein
MTFGKFDWLLWRQVFFIHDIVSAAHKYLFPILVPVQAYLCRRNAFMFSLNSFLREA